MEGIVRNGVEAATTDIISQIITSLWTKLKTSYKKYMIPFPEHFVHYTTECYDKFSKVKCLAKSQAIMPLKKIYIPLTLNHTNDDRVKYRVEGYLPSFFGKYNQVLVVDTAGMGKSTLAKKLFLDIIDNGFGVPLFIELRRLSQKNDILTEIKKQIDSFQSSFPLDLLYSFLNDGNFIFILDGYDEIALSEKQNVTTQLQDFIMKASKNVFIMTSRYEQALSSFEGFETFNILPLKKEEAFKLLKNYDNDGGEVSSLLISQLEKSKDYDEFLGNPLLASMLLSAFTFKNEIPREKHVFYRTVFDALFNSHDLTKGGAYQHEKHSNLGIEQFHKVLRYIGTICLHKNIIEFVKDDLISIIEQAIKFCPEIQCPADAFFEDIIEVVPLFVKDGNYFRWSHKSLSEYFMAQNIYRDITDREKVLQGMASAELLEKYYNVLDLYYDIDFATFRRSIIQSLFKDVVSHVEKGQVLSQNSIRWRQCSFICPEYYLVLCPELKQKKGGKIAPAPTKKGDKIDSALTIVREQSKLSLPIWITFDKDESIFAFRSDCESRNERLIHLLFQKKHPSIFHGIRTPVVSKKGFVPHELYKIDEEHIPPIKNEEMLVSILALIESFVFYVDYHKAKEELKDIKADINAADEFAKGLFS